MGHKLNVFAFIFCTFFFFQLKTVKAVSNQNQLTAFIVSTKSENSLISLNLLNVKHLFDHYYVVWTNTPDETLKILQENKFITKIIPNNKVHRNKIPKPEPLQFWNLNYKQQDSAFNDPEVKKQWSFKDAAESGISVNKSYLNRHSRVKNPVIVAIVDTGVDYNHEDLKDKMWKNPGEIPANGIDDDQNGYVDDVYGINTLARNSQGQANGNPKPGDGHGTHVAGIIGAKQNNQLGIAGIAENAIIMAIRTVPDNGDETDVNVVESFLYAAKNGAKIINCSFGKAVSEGGNIVKDAIDHITKEYGVLVVAAAGNETENVDETPSYPAAWPNEGLLVIASTASNGGLSYFSNYGPISVDLGAPGSGIYATYPGNRYTSLSGTSMATPTVVGVAAEVLSAYPELGPIQLKKLLMDNITTVSSFKGKMVAGGRIDLWNALQSAPSLLP